MRTEEWHSDVENDAEEPLALPRRGQRGALDAEGPPAHTQGCNLPARKAAACIIGLQPPSRGDAANASAQGGAPATEELAVSEEREHAEERHLGW